VRLLCKSADGPQTYDAEPATVDTYMQPQCCSCQRWARGWSGQANEHALFHLRCNAPDAHSSVSATGIQQLRSARHSQRKVIDKKSVPIFRHRGSCVSYFAIERIACSPWPIDATIHSTLMASPFLLHFACIQVVQRDLSVLASCRKQVSVQMAN
jgi:hypothetical protein